ncbi:hypothetical protein [Lacticaseibacillus hulanensis]|uniref:hypothetical protein n=1 Tax=Lacticaseibacillus hulanensis TaxID=2493111 RepID=UPI000FD9EAD0|nr:hypothetical protein [Lacticaseibacillus hulanensis]
MSLVTAVLTQNECSVVSDGRISSPDGAIYYEAFKKFRVFDDRFIILGGGYQDPLIEFWHNLENTTLPLSWRTIEEYLRTYMTKTVRYYVLNHGDAGAGPVATIVLAGINDDGKIAAHAFTNDGYGMYDKQFLEPDPGKVTVIACPPPEYPNAQQLLVRNLHQLGPQHYLDAQINTQLTVAETAFSVNAKSFGAILTKDGTLQEIERGQIAI